MFSQELALLVLHTPMGADIQAPYWSGFSVYDLTAIPYCGGVRR